MRKIVIILVTLISTCAAGVAFITYNNNSVENLASVSIVSTDQALLALEPGKCPVGSMVEKNGGVLNFTFDFNENVEQYYRFSQLFYIRNNSVNSITFTIGNDGIRYITIALPGSNNKFVIDGIGTDYYCLLPPGAHTAIEVSFNVPAFPMELVIEGKLLVRALAVD